ncbi:MAG: hypothetical protein M3P93_08410 [Actinomycetota bacterium]|nr:hypothetical protein [Actinomycetota bacterium]
MRTTAAADVRAEWLSQGLAHVADDGDGPDTDEQGRLLWLHPVSVLSRCGLADVVNDLAPPFAERLDIERGELVAGIGWSAVALDAPTSGAADMPIRLIQLHWAYYALYMAMNRGLLQVLDQRRWRHNSSLRQLEADAEAVFADYLRAMNARARLDSKLSALGGDESAVWEAIARVQRFDSIVEAVERKLDVMDKLAEHRVGQAQAYRARRNGDILGYLTVLTVVTAAGGVIGVLAGAVDPSRGSFGFRLLIVLLALAVASCVYYLAFVRSTRLPPSMRRGGVQPQTRSARSTSRLRQPTST